MYRSLYSVLDQLISAKSTGVLNIVHYSTRGGMIYFSSGTVVHVTTDSSQGIPAANKIFSWATFLAQFKKKPVSFIVTPKDINQTKKIMAHLGKIDKKIEKIRETIVGNEAILHFDQPAINDEKPLPTNDLSIASAMDGSKTIEQIFTGSKFSELQILIAISRFVDNGFAKVIRPHEPIPTVENDRRFAKLIEILSGIIGPVASVLVNEACDAMDMEQNSFCESDFKPLLLFIMEKLGEDEQHAIIKAYQ